MRGSLDFAVARALLYSARARDCFYIHCPLRFSLFQALKQSAVGLILITGLSSVALPYHCHQQALRLRSCPFHSQRSFDIRRLMCTFQVHG